MYANEVDNSPSVQKLLNKWKLKDDSRESVFCQTAGYLCLLHLFIAFIKK